MAILVAMFGLGVYTLLAQMAIMRELEVLCLGNELTVAVVFMAWLSLIGLGAWVGRRFPWRGIMAGALALLAVLLPAVLVILRLAAGLVRGAGEYTSLPSVMAAAVLALAPVCPLSGMLFPLACARRAGPGRPHAAGAVYAAEAMGSFVGGGAYAFVLVERLGGLHVTVLAAACALAGAACLAGSVLRRAGLAAIAVAALAAAWFPGVLGAAEWRTVESRWRALGVIGRVQGAEATRLVATRDTRYQNLALTASDGRHVLYGDGKVLFAFPDEVGAETSVHFVMAQRPDAHRVLILGGNPVAELPELLKYGLDRVVYVELDPGVEAMIKPVSEVYAGLGRDPRLRLVHEDGPRFVAACRERFDVILVHAPEPTTGGLNRYYTREFYEQARRLLAPGGFLHTSVEGSERLEREASVAAGSVYKTLRAVFGEVKVTFGTPVQFFAAAEPGTLTFDRVTLRARSWGARLHTLYFRPDYFLGAEELDPQKVAVTEQRLAASTAAINTLSHPVSYYYMLTLWSRYSGSRIEPFLRGIERWRPPVLCAGILLAGMLYWAAGAWARRRGPGSRGRSPSPARPEARVSREREAVSPREPPEPERSLGWSRYGIVLAMATIGFGGVAGELILLYAFQGVFGYVYGRIGLMIGLFMLGSVAGAAGAGRLERAFPRRGKTVLAAASLTLAGVIGLVPLLMDVPGVASGIVRGAMEGLMAVIGALVGAEFVVVNGLLQATGLDTATAAGVTGATDYVGSALGALLVGVVLMPVFGMWVACAVVGALLVAGVMCVSTCD